MAALKCSVALILLYFSNVVHSASILALFSSLSYSDHLVFRGYVSLLAQKGHSIVVMTPYPGQFQHPDTERIVELDVGHESAPFWDEFKQLVTNVDDHYPRLKAMNELLLKIAIAQLRSKQMTALFINPNVKFDLLITEAEVPLLYAVADKYQVPHITITPSSGKIHQHEAKGNPIHPILYPDVNTLNYRNLTVWQKFMEFHRHIQTKYEFYNSYLPLSEVAAKKILGLKRDLQEVEYDIDLLLICANPALIGNRPTVPAVIFSDRMQIKPILTISKKLKSVLDQATKGVIYFSVGAVQDAEELPKYMLETIADTFRELPFTVLWKIGNTTLIKTSENVITQSWFPQQEVLAHPNVKAFITHGGARSLEEAIYYDTPIIGLPLVRSRKVFIREITKYGAGEILDPYYLEKKQFKETILEVVNNQNYKKAVSKLKSMVYDQMISGPENAVWWTEYVLRHGGARFLRSPAVGVSFIKYYMLDIIALLFATLFSILWLTYIILRYTIRRICIRFSRGPNLNGKFKAL